MSTISRIAPCLLCVSIGAWVGCSTSEKVVSEVKTEREREIVQAIENANSSPRPEVQSRDFQELLQAYEKLRLEVAQLRSELQRAVLQFKDRRADVVIQRSVADGKRELESNQLLAKTGKGNQELEPFEDSIKNLSEEFGVKIDIQIHDLNEMKIPKITLVRLNKLGTLQELLIDALIQINPQRVSDPADPNLEAVFVVTQFFDGPLELPTDKIIITTRQRASERGKLPEIFAIKK